MLLINKLNREKLFSKVQEYKFANREKLENINDFILNELSIIKNELSKYKSIKNSDYILSVRQKHCVNEFQQYIKEKKCELAFYDLEEFIQCEVYPADKFNNGFIYSKIICDKEIEIINNMINTLEKECNIQLYSDKFGGFPYFLFMGATDEVIINAIKEALESSKEIEIKNDEGIDY